MRERLRTFNFNAKDREFINLMMSLGQTRNVSNIVILLSKAGEASSSDIEDFIDLRQSEVSIATKSLRDKGWVKTRIIKQNGKGRPTQMYKLRFSLRRIVKDVEAEKNTEMEEVKKKIAHLKRLAK
ncbi:MAG: ArsR family transcriptional regulator [Thermoplasmata archaeon]|nr:MAG: ArsR family transcriptional regulator [Thermoplasmata archaeon]